MVKRSEDKVSNPDVGYRKYGINKDKIGDKKGLIISRKQAG
jgi:hypothetical protein